MQLEDLPEELLSLIGSFLPQGESLTTFALLNQRFSRLCRPLFLASIFLYLCLREGWWTEVVRDSDHKYFRLLRKLRDQPVLGHHVRKLQINIIASETCGLPPGLRLPSLINALPNLRILKLKDPFGYAGAGLRSALDHFAVDQPIPGDDTRQNEAYDRAVVETFVRLSRKAGLKTLVLYNVSWRFPPDLLAYQPILPGTSSVVDLCLYGLQNHVNYGQYFVPIRNHHVSLKRLHFELKWHEFPSDRLHPFRLGQILGAIRQLSSTLEELYICTGNTTTVDLDSEEHDILLSFLNLRRLALPAGYVSSQSSSPVLQLPQTLEQLQLQYSMIRIPNEHTNGQAALDSALHQKDMEEMRSFLLSASEHLPTLRRVIWWIQGPHLLGNWPYGCGSYLDDLESCFTRNPRFEWLSEPSALYTPLLKETRV